MLCWTVHLKGPRLDVKGAAVTVGCKVYFIGGFYCYGPDKEIEVNVFNTVSLRWKELLTTGRESSLEVPTMRWYHTAVLIEHIIYMYGGNPYSNILCAFDVDTHKWFKPVVSGTVPEERENHSACVLGKVMYIYGGSSREAVYFNDIYKLDTITMVWSLINTRGTPAPASVFHTATVIGTKMFVFGGRAESPDHHHTRVFDTETNCWLNTPSAQLLTEVISRVHHSAFAYNGELYIFGGLAHHTFCNDMWKFSLETFSWKKVEPSWKMVEPKGKGLCSRLDMACSTVGDCAIFFGGGNTIGALYDLYVLDLSPSLKTLCKLAVILYGLEQSELPHDIRWELAAMTGNRNRHTPSSQKKKKQK